MAEDSDSRAIADATTSFLEAQEDGDRVLETVLATDGEHATWTFDDIELDSGTFGELVSRGIVENADGGYRVADPAAVEAALAGDELEADRGTEPADRAVGLERLRTAVDPRAMLALLGALIVVAGARATAFRAVFQRGRVVSPGNDPYYFRYWMETLVGDASGPLDYGVLVDSPAGVFGTRPFAHATNWVVAELLGGGQGAADTVAAWLPVIASVALGVAIYACAVSLTRDARVGVASVLVFAVTPINAVYTGLGFLDHQLHQYFWLGITILTLTRLAVDLQQRLETGNDGRAAVRNHLQAPATWLVAAAFGLSVTAGVHAWGGSPLLLVPLAATSRYGSRWTLEPASHRCARTYRCSPGWPSGAPSRSPCTTAGLARGVRRDDARAGARRLDRRGRARRTVAAATRSSRRVARPRRGRRHCGAVCVPTAAAGGLGGSDGSRRGSVRPWRCDRDGLAVLDGVLRHLRAALPARDGVLHRAGGARLGRVARLPAVRTRLVARRYLRGIPPRTRGHPSAVRRPARDSAGRPHRSGLIRLLAVVDLARPPVSVRDSEPGRSERFEADPTVAADGGLEPAIAMPDGRRIAYLLGIGLLVFGLSLVYVPSLTADVTYSEAQLEAVDAIDDHADAANRTYPETFVLSEWGDNRMYNHFVNGESQGYSYARNNYEAFVTGTDPDGWYDKFNGRVGYVVVTESNDEDIPDDSAQARLLENQARAGPAPTGSPTTRHSPSPTMSQRSRWSPGRRLQCPVSRGRP